MTQSTAHIDAEIRLPAEPVILAIALGGVLAFGLSNVPADIPGKVSVALFAGATLAAAAVAWWLKDRHPMGCRWLVLALGVVLTHATGMWLGFQATLAYAPVAVLLAILMLGLPAAALTALVESGLAVAVAAGSPGSSLAGLLIALLSLWAVLGISGLVHRRVRATAQWSWEHYVRAQRTIEEAQNQKLELESALKSVEEANRQYSRLNQLAQGLRKLADDARNAKEQFVANVSHELRTPLNMIIGFTDMMLQSPQAYGGDIPGALLADLTVIQKNAQHLSSLIDDVLDLSQVETGQMSLLKERADYRGLIEFAAAAVQPLFHLRNLHLKVEWPDALPPVFCDCVRIREVMLNLLSNAGRFTERGGVTVRVWLEGRDVLTSVTDTGPGIAPEDLDRLFHPFEQLDASIRRRFGGTGLGLAISKRFIEMHDGRIWVNSQLGAGTCFTFSIPAGETGIGSGEYARWITPHLPYEKAVAAPRAVDELPLPRVLLVDSGGALERLARRYTNGVEIVRVPALGEADRELSGNPAHCMVMNCPSIDRGLAELADSPVPNRGIPTFLCSVPGAQEASAAMGVADVLIKPISREKLLESLAQHGKPQGTVLVVDDEPDVLHLYSRILSSSQQRYRVLLARDGQEAFDILADYRPDVILLDLIMPGHSGFQFLERRLQSAELRDIPVILISAHDPSGFPVVSRALALTQGQGLSTRQMMSVIEAVSRMLSPMKGPADRAPTASPPG